MGIFHKLFAFLNDIVCLSIAYVASLVIHLSILIFSFNAKVLLIVVVLCIVFKIQVGHFICPLAISLTMCHLLHVKHMDSTSWLP
jgi:hypothetical protein